MTNISIFPAGTKVSANNYDIKGIITACEIRGTSVRYELSYWDKKEHKTAWLHESEIDGDESDRKQIGFAAPKPAAGQ